MSIFLTHKNPTGVPPIIGGLAVVGGFGDRHMGRFFLGRPGPITHKEERGKKGRKGRFNIFATAGFCVEYLVM